MPTLITTSTILNPDPLTCGSWPRGPLTRSGGRRETWVIRKNRPFLFPVRSTSPAKVIKDPDFRYYIFLCVVCSSTSCVDQQLFTCSFGVTPCEVWVILPTLFCLVLFTTPIPLWPWGHVTTMFAFYHVGDTFARPSRSFTISMVYWVAEMRIHIRVLYAFVCKYVFERIVTSVVSKYCRGFTCIISQVVVYAPIYFASYRHTTL